MNLRHLLSTSLCASALLLAVSAQAAPAQQPRHPSYLHALSDLRFARAHLQPPDGGAVPPQAQEAIKQIDRAIAEIKKASIDDGKNLNDHPAIDAHFPWGGRLQKALILLDKAHGDVSREEDDPAAAGLQQRALDHIDKAHKLVEAAIAAGQ